MKITAIKQQVKRSDRYSIYVDEAYSFSLSEGALLKSGIASGQELSADEVTSFKQLSSDDKVYNQALRYVAMRARTVWELKSYLSRKEVAEARAEQIIQQFQELGLLNDAAYAVSFVRDRQLLKPSSKRKIMLELKRKHIAEVHIQEALAENKQDDTENVAQVVAKLRRQGKYQDDTKLMNYLARQGFGYGDIKRALKVDEDY
jgi:regulatory protein